MKPLDGICRSKVDRGNENEAPQNLPGYSADLGKTTALVWRIDRAAISFDCSGKATTAMMINMNRHLHIRNDENHITGLDVVTGWNRFLVRGK